MFSLKNILIVEDDNFIVDRIYKTYLSDYCDCMDYASSKEEAIEKIRCKTYRIAYVDIMLSDDPHDRKGLDVIEFINKMREGTQIVVVSATEDIRVALKSYKIGIFDFLQKDNIRGKDDLIAPAKRVLDNEEHYSINYFGRYFNVFSYLSAPELAPYWEDRIRSVLSVPHNVMIGFMGNAFARITPLLRSLSGCDLKEDPDNKCVSGLFWSKKIGSAVFVSINNTEGSGVKPDNEFDMEIYSKEKGKLKISIWKISGVSRNKFRESIWDE